MKALQVKGVGNEGLIAHQQKRIKNMTNRQDPPYSQSRVEGKIGEGRSSKSRDGGEGVNDSVGPSRDGEG